MDWFESILINHSAMQAVVVISLIIAAGLGLSKIHVAGVSLGITWVFFAGIFAGHLGLSVDPGMLAFAEGFGLALFVYELGLKVGPGFFSSFRTGGMKLNLLGLGVIALGTLITIIYNVVFSLPMGDMVGVLCGATTNTPALGAAQQTLQQLGIDASGAALSCAVTYPLGVVGVILGLVAIRFMLRPADSYVPQHDDPNATYIASFQVQNPAIFGKSVKQIAELSKAPFIISRLWRDGKVSIPVSDTKLLSGDRLLVVTVERDIPALTVIFGEQESKDWNKEDIDWDAIDSQLVSKEITVTKTDINGRKLGSLHLRNSYNITISRVWRSGVPLLATPDLVLQMGDKLVVVGEKKAIENVAHVVGNATLSLKDPNLAAIFIGLLLGLVLGSVPLSIPGISAPVKLGLAGGPILMGILIGRFGPRLHLVTYTTRSANLMLRSIGLSLYLSCLGLEAGARFFETLLHGDGLTWVMLGFIITVVPVMIMGILAMRIWKLDFGSAAGMLCGSMANPMALTYVNDTVKGDNPAVSYATVYPLAMFTRVVIAQVLILIFL